MFEKHKSTGSTSCAAGVHRRASRGPHETRAERCVFPARGRPRVRGVRRRARQQTVRRAPRAAARGVRGVAPSARGDDVFSETADDDVARGGLIVAGAVRRRRSGVRGPRVREGDVRGVRRALLGASGSEGKAGGAASAGPAPAPARPSARPENQKRRGSGPRRRSRICSARFTRGSRERARSRGSRASAGGRSRTCWRGSGCCGGGCRGIRRAIVSIVGRAFHRKKKMGSHALEDTFSFSPEVPSRWPAQSSPRGRKAAGGAGLRYRPRREGDARGVSVGVAAEDPSRVTSARGERASGIDLSCRMGRLRDVTAGLSATFARLRGRTRDAPANAKQHHRRRRRRKVRALPPIRPSEASRLDREEASSGTEQTAFFFATNLVSFRTRRADAPRPSTDDSSHPDRIPTPSISHALTHTHSRTHTHTHAHTTHATHSP